MLTAEQIRAARALLGWSQEQLAHETKLGLGTVKRLETQRGLAAARFENIGRVRNAFENAGVEFIDGTDERGEGLRFKRPRGSG